jgi:hypothetical protein
VCLKDAEICKGKVKEDGKWKMENQSWRETANESAPKSFADGIDPFFAPALMKSKSAKVALQVLSFLALFPLVMVALEDYFESMSLIIYGYLFRRFAHYGLFGMNYGTFGRISEWALMTAVFALPAWLVIRPPGFLRSRHLLFRAGAAIFFTQVATCVLYYGLILPLMLLVIHHGEADHIGIYEAIIFRVPARAWLVLITGITLVYCVFDLAIRACFPKRASEEVR